MDSFLTTDMQFNIAVFGELMMFLYALPLTLAPHKQHELYFVKPLEFKSDTEKEHVLSINCQENLALVTCTLIFGLVAFNDFDREVAIGVSVVPWLILMLFFLLNEYPQKFGNSTKGLYCNVAMFAFVAYATIMETEYSSLAVKLLAGFTVTHGLFLLLSPTTHAAFWGNVESGDFLMFTARCLGANVLDLGVMLCALIAGLPLVLCCGLGWACAFFTFLLLLGDFQKFNMDMPKVYGWMVVMAFFAVTLSLQLPAVVQEEVGKEE